MLFCYCYCYCCCYCYCYYYHSYYRITPLPGVETTFTWAGPGMERHGFRPGYLSLRNPKWMKNLLQGSGVPCVRFFINLLKASPRKSAKSGDLC